ncbi:hypothetical protein D5018_21305 [Parashewanella curva]|uniref:Uncharacterized protein n=1 Tax=Parashewanella curva TaxID=2338552 RepID=A0A3L8PQJ7_9GAMM|nr:hypothetical protein [Parashewanella curva]RLV57676.1 hypothetical protein D5018_21305 [Parashewanella curva]
MINIGTTDFYIDVSSLPREKFEEYSTQLFDEWESYVADVLGLPDYSLSLDVEEGSVKALGKIGVTLGALYIGIGQYGSFISGIETIQRQVRSASDYLGERASAPFSHTNKQPRIKKRGEDLSRLKTIFVKVKRGDLTIEQAMEISEEIFGEDTDEANEFLGDLRVSLEETPLDPQQMSLELDNIKEMELTAEEKKTPKPRKPKPKIPAVRPEQYRVQVWRKSKRSKRNIRVTRL